MALKVEFSYHFQFAIVLKNVIIFSRFLLRSKKNFLGTKFVVAFALFFL